MSNPRRTAEGLTALALAATVATVIINALLNGAS